MPTREELMDSMKKLILQAHNGDLTKTPHVDVVWGYLIQSDEKIDVWRLYLTPEFDEYLEFTGNTTTLTINGEDTKVPGALIHYEPLSTDLYPVGGAIVWIRRNSQVRHTKIESVSQEADFLRGDINRDYLPGSQMRSMQRSGVNFLTILINHYQTGHIGCGGSWAYPGPCPGKAWDIGDDIIRPWRG